MTEFVASHYHSKNSATGKATRHFRRANTITTALHFRRIEIPTLLLCAVGLLGGAFALLGSIGDPAAETAQISFLVAGLVGLVGIPMFLGGFVGFGQRHRVLAKRVEELEQVAEVLKRRSSTEHIG